MSSDDALNSGPVTSPAPGLHLRLQKLFEHGTRKAATGDHEYAIEMFQQCVQGDPSNLAYLQGFLDALRKKYNNNKRGDKMAGLKGSGLRSQVRKNIAKKDFNAAIVAGSEMLKLNPWDLATLQSLAEACERLDYDECQLAYLRAALDGNLKDVDLNRNCAKALTKRGLYDQAITCWHRVEQAKPYDEEALKAIADLSIERTVNKGNPGQLAKKDTTKREVVVQLSPEQQLEQTIQQNPADLDKYLELADLYQKGEKFDQAEATLKKGLDASGGELRFRERIEEMQLAYERRRLVIAERRAKETPTDESRDLYKRIKAEFNRKELDFFRGRLERYPEQVGNKLELAIRLKKAGSYADAIPLLQEIASHSPDHKGTALIELGECQQYLKQYQPALENYYAASKLLADTNSEGCKLALYRASVLALGLKNAAVANKLLTRLKERDPNYRDLPDLLDKLAKLSHKG